MRYKAAEDYILGFSDYEKVPQHLYSSADFDLRRVQGLLDKLEDPHLSARSVHIAGTKGKGSTAAMIASVLRCAGYRTGLFTSPHLHTLRERICVDGDIISEGELAGLIERCRPQIDAVNSDAAHGKLTAFEVLTALAFVYFKDRKVHFQILETGLGGRLDATNVVRPDVCVITPISIDHTQVLGESLDAIAAEKAGIIKPGATVVSSPQPSEVSEVIGRICREKGTRLIVVGGDPTCQKKSFGLWGQSFHVSGIGYEYELTIPLLGDHQMENAATAVAVLQALAGMGMKITAEHILSGMSNVNWPGRLQILQYNPVLVVDGAHNADSAKRLREAIIEYFSFHRLVLILGTSCDKDIGGIVRELAPICDTAIATRSQHPRSAQPAVLRDEFAKCGVEARIAESSGEAARRALAIAHEDDLICAAGSLFIAAEMIRMYEELRGWGDCW